MELLLIVLRAAGFGLRKDDPAALKVKKNKTFMTIVIKNERKKIKFDGSASSNVFLDVDPSDSDTCGRMYRGKLTCSGRF